MLQIYYILLFIKLIQVSTTVIQYIRMVPFSRWLVLVHSTWDYLLLAVALNLQAQNCAITCLAFTYLSVKM